MRAAVLSPAAATAYSRFYCAPSSHRFLTLTHLLRCRDRLCRSARFWNLSFSHSPGGDLSPFLSACPFFRMEVAWAFYALFIASCGAYCIGVSDDAKNSICPGNLDLNSKYVDAPYVEAISPAVSTARVELPSKQFRAGSGSGRNKAMVENLQRYGVISSKKVAEIMEALDRGLFVPDGAPAYVDSPMPIGYNATISAPHMHATCLQLLEEKLQPGMRALDVGSGTGYLTACFALMVGPEGRAVGVEHIPELVDMSIKNVEKSVAATLLKQGSLSLHVGDGRQGWPEFAPYDTIHVGAAAPEVPQALLDQLKPGGRMVIPVGSFFQDLKVVDKNEDGSIRVHTETSVRYVPLTSREEQLGG